MNSEKNLNIVFGTGPLGCAVAEDLISKGKQVKMVNRSGIADIPKEAVLITADANDRERTREICKGASVVYHCAMPPYTQWKELFPPLTRGIIAGAVSANAKLIYADNLYMYGISDTPINENTAISPLGVKGKIRAEMSDNLLSEHNNGKMRVAIGRASDFYGPKVISAVLGERVFKPAIEGKTISMLGGIDNPHTYTFIKDFARGLTILGEKTNALGEVWHIPSAETITTRELLHLIFNETRKTPEVKIVPKFITTLLYKINPIVKELKEVMPTHENPYLVDHSKFKNFFEFEATPHKKAIKETVHWYKEKFN